MEQSRLIPLLKDLNENEMIYLVEVERFISYIKPILTETRWIPFVYKVYFDYIEEAQDYNGAMWKAIHQHTTDWKAENLEHRATKEELGWGHTEYYSFSSIMVNQIKRLDEFEFREPRDKPYDDHFRFFLSMLESKRQELIDGGYIKK